jgi:hypothetical protein
MIFAIRVTFWMKSAPISFAAQGNMSPLTVPVCIILCGGSQEKMMGVHATVIVAMVANIESIRRFPHPQSVRKAMRVPMRFSYPEPSIAVFEFPPQPFPAFVVTALVNPADKPHGFVVSHFDCFGHQ